MTKRPSNKDDILNAIRRTATDLGKRPSRSAFIGHTGISEYQILKHFPSRNSAVEAAGLEPDMTNVQLVDEELLSDWGRLVRELRQIPTRVQYRHYGKFSAGSFEHHFGPWSCLPEKFRAFAEQRAEWPDVLALLPVKKPDTMFTHFNRSTSEENTGIETTFVPTSPAQSHSKLDDRPVYGNPIDFRGLRHEPVNENGVIFLFDIVARELGYSAEAVQAGFPDCEAKRQIAADKWQRVRIEFEYESRNFRDHGHSVERCDVIICWHHNWPNCPSHI